MVVADRYHFVTIDQVSDVVAGGGNRGFSTIWLSFSTIIILLYAPGLCVERVRLAFKNHFPPKTPKQLYFIQIQGTSSSSSQNSKAELGYPYMHVSKRAGY